MGNPKPVRSEVWLIDFGIAAKVRPALVVSEPYGDEDRALKGAFLLQGFVTVPPPYFVKKLGMLSESQMKLIENGLKDWLRL